MIQKIIVVSSKVKNRCLVLLDQLENSIEETGVFSFPGTGLFQLPTVNDVTIQDQVVTLKLLQKSGYFLGFGSLGTEVDVRDDESFVIGFQAVSFDPNLNHHCKPKMLSLLRICFVFGMLWLSQWLKNHAKLRKE